MAQPLTPFYPIFPCKSDGQDVVNQKGAPLRNGPTEEQLDRTPNEQGQSDYYRLIDKDEPKHIDWRKKLGGMLLREIGGKQHEDKWQQCILYDFPEGYRLFEHIKSKANGESKPVKNHSGGGHDRQDAYLYGYPKGPRKRFRSPVEFFPHLLWLCTDETSDYQNCSCRICSPMQLEIEKPAPPVKPEIKPDLATAARKENGPTPTTQPPVTVRRNPIAQIPAPRESTSTPVNQTPSLQPATASSAPGTPQIKPPARKEPTPLPQPRGIDQQVDAQYGRFVARTGEVVWFHRPESATWSLGLVVRRWVPKDSPSDRAYLIQPLSHPYLSPAQEIVTAVDHLKPWLAWSPPPCTFDYLNKNPSLTYHNVDWNALIAGQYGAGHVEVDSAILAAKAIDTTYCLITLLKTTTKNGLEERHYNGLYLGGEKIWNGDPVRLRMAAGTNIMVVTDIIEKANPGSPHFKVQLIGDVYMYSTLPVSDPTSPPQAPSSAGIPPRMREDMAWRNQFLVPATRTLAYWQLMATNQVFSIPELKGRWYETSMLFVKPFHEAIKRNEGGNVMPMNSRGDITGLGNSDGIPWADRVASFEGSVPKGLQLVPGVDDPSDQAKAQGSEMQGLELSMGPGTGDNTFALDDFMTFDHNEEGGVTFEDNFNF